jgi:poly(hydroxyalkanoate) depolymerase family esterase
MIKLLYLFLLCSAAQASRHTFFLQGRSYQFVSPHELTENRPLLVLLHGCKQNSDIILEGTNLEEEALKRNFYILAPEQGLLSNEDHCWNWFYSTMQTRNPFSEMGEIISALELVIPTHKINRSRIFVAGLSAGAALAENLSACYPDYFTGAAIHSGLAFKIAENIFEAQTVLTSSSQKNPDYLGLQAYRCFDRSQGQRKLMKSLIIHGLDDQRVLPLHAELNSNAHEVVQDLYDDNRINHSNLPRVSEHLTSFPNGYQALHIQKNYKNFTEQTIFVKGLGHAWGGGKPISANFNPDAPSSNLFILNFFNL